VANAGASALALPFQRHCPCSCWPTPLSSNDSGLHRLLPTMHSDKVHRSSDELHNLHVLECRRALDLGRTFRCPHGRPACDAGRGHLSCPCAEHARRRWTPAAVTSSRDSDAWIQPCPCFLWECRAACGWPPEGPRSSFLREHRHGGVDGRRPRQPPPMRTKAMPLVLSAFNHSSSDLNQRLVVRSKAPSGGKTSTGRVSSVRFPHCFHERVRLPAQNPQTPHDVALAARVTSLNYCSNKKQNVAHNSRRERTALGPPGECGDGAARAVAVQLAREVADGR
jgi:hypothetical protein